MGARMGVRMPIIGVYDYGRGIYGVWWYAAWGYGGNYLYFFAKSVIGVLGTPTLSKNRAKLLPDSMSCPYHHIANIVPDYYPYYGWHNRYYK
jgi:hypothetical protein